MPDEDDETEDDTDETNETDEIVGLEDEATVVCPHCFESQLLVIDPETSGQFVQDCDVCCNPWTVTVTRDEEGALSVQVDPAS
jgi:hypothetical protein